MVLRMSKMIQVRDVPDDVHRVLKTRAAAEGLSLSDYIKRDLEAAARRATFDEVDARIAARGRLGTSTAADTVRIIREARGD